MSRARSYWVPPAQRHRVGTLNYWTESRDPRDHVRVLVAQVEACLGAARLMDPYFGTALPVGDPGAARRDAAGWWAAARFAAASAMRRRPQW